MSADRLYFVPILVRGLQEDDSRAGMRKAFREIYKLGQHPRYQEGYRQFLQFMELAFGEADRLAGAVDDPLPEEVGRQDILELQFEKDGLPLASLAIPPTSSARTVTGLSPGHYRIKLDTGWVLWAGRLEATDLLWARAFPGRELRVAASTESSGQLFTRELSLLGGTVVVRVQPGLEMGSFAVVFGIPKEGG